MIGPRHRQHEAAALAELLGEPNEGAVAFLRCLSSAQVDALADAPDFDVPGWTVNAVVDVPGTRRITADQAVERREDKADAALFLIDPLRAGAGLDGIYTAAREIGEADLFNAAHKRARKRLHGRVGVLNGAMRRAGRLGRRRKLTPWQEFDFLVAAEQGEGGALARLGLWPVAGEEPVSEADLDLSAAMADRLLFASDARTIGERVRALMLEDAVRNAPALERFLRSLTGRGPEDAAAAIAEHPEFWLGPLRPRFGGETLRKVQLVSWRDARGGVLRWSGLRLSEGESVKPHLVLDRDAPTKDRAKLTVRWTSEPDQLTAGSVEYRVAVLAGDETLAELTVAHREKSPQQAVFAVEDFEDLEGTEKFEALVQVTAVAAEEVDPVSSEEFVLAFGQVEGLVTSGSGRIVRSLVEGMITLPDRRTFEEATATGASASRLSEDRKGFITWKGQSGGSAVRVFRPALIRRVEVDWTLRGGPPGRWIQAVRADGSPAGDLRFVEFSPAQPEAATWERVRDASRRLATEIGPFGLLARVHGGGLWVRTT